jgi:uncharacterized metal-binding protein
MTSQDTTLKLVFSCSGAADVAEIADLAARQLNRQTVGKMYSLAGVGGRVPEIVQRTKTAAKIVVIDGCEKTAESTACWVRASSPSLIFG